MKKICLFMFIPIALLCMGFSNKLASLSYGVYPVKIKSLTFLDLVTKEIDLAGNLAELTWSKPENVTVDAGIQIKNPVYGNFLFGNNNRRVWFVMGKDATGYWNDFYIDRNLDNQITFQEKVKGFENSAPKYKGYKSRQSLGLIPVSLKIAYLGANGEFSAKLSFLFSINEIGNGNETNNNLIVEAFDTSFLEGTALLENDRDRKPTGFRLIDANSNGCFNDFCSDIMFLDLNHDAVYRPKEAFKMIEFFDREDARRQRNQLHLVVTALPTKIAVLNALEEYDDSQFEPPADLDRTSSAPPRNSAK